MRLHLTQRLWFYRVLTLLATAVLVHLLAVWAAPRLVMYMLMHGPQAQVLQMHNQAAFAPPVTAKSRRVVLPSPDLLYSVCSFDVSKGPLRVRANPQLPHYWSIALYAANSDNFFVINDRQARDKPVDLWLVSSAANASSAPVPAGSTLVLTPSDQGFLLMRTLVADYAREAAVVEPARRTLQCSEG